MGCHTWEILDTFSVGGLEPHTARFIFRCPFVGSYSVFSLFNYHPGQLPCARDYLGFGFLWNAFHRVSTDLWRGVSVANVAQLQLLLCKNPEQNLTISCILYWALFWKTNATLKLPPSEVYVNPIPNLPILLNFEKRKKTFLQSGNDRLFLFFFFFVKDCF